MEYDRTITFAYGLYIPEDGLIEKFFAQEGYPMKLEAVGESDALVVDNKEQLSAWLDRNFTYYGFSQLETFK